MLFNVLFDSIVIILLYCFSMVFCIVLLYCSKTLFVILFNDIVCIVSQVQSCFQILFWIGFGIKYRFLLFLMCNIVLFIVFVVLNVQYCFLYWLLLFFDYDIVHCRAGASAAAEPPPHATVRQGAPP